MQRWDYLEVTVSRYGDSTPYRWIDNTGRWGLLTEVEVTEGEALLHRSSFLGHALTHWGAEGWELVGVAGEKLDDFWLFFKRPAP